ncbi:MAG: chorismate synthase [Saprospiraceae bacterium]|nr:chorismate synthase [Saprospiraceae bacterium]
MNSFGRIFRIHIFGESHGPSVGVLMDGIFPGIPLTEKDFEKDLLRRKAGSVGRTSRTESDLPIIKSGVFNGYTTGAPLLIEFENSNIKSSDYQKFIDQPRPGHADFTARQKYAGFNDPRGGGHFSGRLTLCLVAAGVLAKKMIPGINIQAKLIEAGGLSDIEKAIQLAIEKQDSIGGIIECNVEGLPIGFGEPFFDSLESQLSHLIFSIPAIKGIEFGSGFLSSKMFGSQNNDPIINAEGQTLTNHSGGIHGGISNGNPLNFKIAVKPTSSTPQEQSSFNYETQQVEKLKVTGRHDLCLALRVPVVVEAATAIVLADFKILHLSNRHLR